MLVWLVAEREKDVTSLSGIKQDLITVPFREGTSPTIQHTTATADPLATLSNESTAGSVNPIV